MRKLKKKALCQCFQSVNSYIDILSCLFGRKTTQVSSGISLFANHSLKINQLLSDDPEGLRFQLWCFCGAVTLPWHLRGSGFGAGTGADGSGSSPSCATSFS